MSTTPQSMPPVLVLVGPTAIGKTALSLEIAERFECEIVSVDSMQVYRYMDIGTAKASIAERSRVPHHLIDIVDPDEQYDAARFVRDATAAIIAIHQRQKLPLLTGGTGLYLKALIDGIFESLPVNHRIRARLRERLVVEGEALLHQELAACDPPSASRIHVNDSQRLLRALEIYQCTGIPWSSHLHEQQGRAASAAWSGMLQIGLTCDRQTLYDRINERCRGMIAAGLEQEVHELLERGYRKDLPSLQSIGYKHMINYIDNTWTSEQMLTYLSRDTRRYAKRQFNWFNGIRELQWYAVDDSDSIIERISFWLDELSLRATNL
ncbi:MAG TPA: tRNA (adenosine(37)-N6)-dimethylallyltransferase MiaA [Desulfoprunum sp.]|nr:tRNA (adenosine(37)-N6)-dimethylallyltransferase MiaA [Desulfoprunum sp.]